MMNNFIEPTKTALTNILYDNYSNQSNQEESFEQTQILNSEFAIKLNNLLYSSQFYVAIAILWSSITILSIFGKNKYILDFFIKIFYYNLIIDHKRKWPCYIERINFQKTK